MAERAGYTVTMFIVDVSPSMGKVREVEVEQSNGETRTIEMTNLEWALQFVKLKVQEMIYNGRKTDQCGVILFGTEETDNIVNAVNEGYEHVSEYIPIGTPTSDTISRLSEIVAGDKHGDPIDAIIVGIETQAKYLISKKTWTRKMVLLTDGESPIEIEDWEKTAAKMNDVRLKFTLVGIDFDDENYGFEEEDKSDMKRVNEEFYHQFVDTLEEGLIGNAAFALEEISRPDTKQTKSALLGTTLCIGDIHKYPDESVAIDVKVSKCTALARPKTWKKFAVRRNRDDPEDIVMKEPDDEDEERKTLFAQLAMHTKYILSPGTQEEDDGADSDSTEKEEEPVEKEDLIRGYKYGSSYAPCPDGQFPKLEYPKSIEICGVMDERNFRHDWAMGEIQYVWADPASPSAQVALSSISEALYEGMRMAIARMVTRTGSDPKMGLLKAVAFENTDCLLWIPMPFADDIRKYPFASLERLVNKKGEVVTKHPYLPTDDQMEAMDKFVDAMDLMEAGEKDEDGIRQPWFETNLSFNPAIHRIKQAQFHAAVVSDLNRQPVPPPHPELTKYFNTPRRVLKKAKGAIEEAKAAFKVREVPMKITRSRKDDHIRARDEGDDSLLLDKVPNKKRKVSANKSQSQYTSQATTKTSPKSQLKARKKAKDDSDTEPESETEPEFDQEELLLASKDKEAARPDASGAHLPTPPPSEKAEKPDGRFISWDYPLADFETNLARGDLVTKVVDDMAFIIKDIVLRPFSARRTPEMLECIKKLRELASNEDEVEAYNAFLYQLKDLCLGGSDGMPSNEEFWERVVELGPDISLIKCATVTDATIADFRLNRNRN